MIEVARDTLLFVLILGGLAAPFLSRLTRYAPPERVVLALAASLAAVYLWSTVIYLTRMDPRWHWMLVPAGLLGFILSRNELRALGREPSVRAAITGWLLVAAWCLGLTAVITSYAGGRWAGDWYEHFERACFFLEQWPAEYRFIGTYALPARPPLANLVTGALLALGSHDYARYQVITCLLATLVYFPLLAICRMFGGGALAAALVAPALMLNPLFVQNATFPWTKLPAAFFVLATIPLLVRSLREPADRWHLPAAAGLLAAGMLTHYSSAVWLLALAVGWLLASGSSKSLTTSARPLLLAGLVSALLLVTWFGWALARYGPGSTLGSNSSANAAQRLSVGDATTVGVRNLINTIVPHPLLGTTEPVLLQSNQAAVVADWFFHLYQETLPLAWGTAGLGLLLVAWRRCGPPGSERLFWLSALPLAGFLGVITHTQPSAWGLTHISLQPLVLLGLAWLAARLPEIWRGLPGWSRPVLLALGLMDFVGGIVMHFVVQHGAAARIAEHSHVARTNYAGKLRLNQPFLADTLAGPGWAIILLLATLLGLACWRVSAARVHATLPSS